MTPIKFPEHTHVLAEDQPEYLPLPVHRDAEGVVTSCWRLTWWERIKIAFTGRLWLSQMTFGQLLQPQLPRVEYPFVPISEE